MKSLQLFGIPLGLAGLGGAWLAAYTSLGAPLWPSEVLFGASALAWLTFTVLYVSREFTLTRAAPDPAVAFIPAVGILLASHYARFAPSVGLVVTVVFVIILFLVAARIIAHWLSNGIEMSSLHGGIFIPVVAGPFIASIGLTSVGLHQGALVVFGAGAFFWLSYGTIVMSRQMTGATLPPPAVPTLSAFLAAPASGGVAWSISHPGPVTETEYFFLGILLTILLAQFVLVNRYRKLPFGLNFWIFTFPVASTANFLLRFLASEAFAGWQVIAWIILGLSTAFVAFIAAHSIVFVARRRPVA